MTGFVIYEKAKEGKREIAVQVFAAAMALLSVFVAFLSVFDVGMEKMVVAAGILIVTVPVGAALWKKEHFWKKVILLTVLTGALAAVFREALVCGMAPFINRYIEFKNQFYCVNEAKIAQEPSLGEQFLALVLIQFLLLLVLLTVQRQKKGGILALLVMILPVILAATVGYMPSTLSSWCLMGAGSFYLIIYRRTNGSVWVREVLAAAGILVALYACTWLFLPQIEKYKEEYDVEYEKIRVAIIDSQQRDVKSMIEDKIGEKLEINGNYAKGGIGEGNLENLSENHSQGIEEMEVIVTERPDTTIYLRAFVGTTYTGKKWEELKTSAFSEVAMPILGSSKCRTLMNEPFTRIAKGENELEAEQMKIRLLGAASDYGYAPYYAEISDQASVKLDAYVIGSVGSERQYMYFPRKDVERLSGGLAEASALWATYQEFAWKTYLEYPDDLNQLDEFCRKLEQGTVEETAKGINRVFASSLKYSLTPGKKPKDQDFVEYFLFDNKSGFCVHFASAATLIYRECGYPARYVEGYAVSPEAFVRQEDGTYQAVVKDKMAHAWCETFDDETGWQVREHTLPYLNEAYEENVTEQTNIQNVPEEPEPSVDENAAENNNIPDNDGNEGQNAEQAADAGKNEESTEGDGFGNADGSDGGRWRAAAGKWIKGVALALVSAALILLAVLVQQRLRRKKKQYRFRKRKENRGIAAIYDEICEICIFSGIERKQRTDREMLEEMKAEFSQLIDEEWEWLYNCAERAAFAGEKIEREEQKRFYQLYWKFRKGVLKEMKGGKKLWFLYGKAM